MVHDNEDDDDGTGYGRPPKRHRFKPGQSGNPTGKKSKRPSGSDTSNPSVFDDVIDELKETLVVRENGRERKISKQRAFIKALVASAIKGDVRAINAVLALARNFSASASDAPSDDDNIEDFEILKSFIERERQRRAREGARPEAPTSDSPNSHHEEDHRILNFESCIAKICSRSRTRHSANFRTPESKINCMWLGSARTSATSVQVKSIA